MRKMQTIPAENILKTEFFEYAKGPFFSSLRGISFKFTVLVKVLPQLNSMVRNYSTASQSHYSWYYRWKEA